MASASQSTPSASQVPTVSPAPTSSSSAATVGPAAPVPPAPGSATTPRPSSTSTSTRVVSTPAAPPSSSTTSTTSTSSSSSSSHASQATVFVPQPSGSDGHGNSSINVVAPIVAVAGILIIIYIAYRIFLLHKRRKDEKIPPPPPRMPAIFERPQSVMYANPPMMMAPGSAPPSYRQSMRPVSMLYTPGQSSSSSSLPTKGALTSASGHSTPTQSGFPVDETGRQSPMAFSQERSLRGGMPPRPHSVASFGSNRYSSYGAPRTPYMNRVEVVLPQLLAPGSSALSSAHGRPNRFSMYNSPPNSDMRPQSMILPPLAVTPEGDWAHRVTSTAEERASSSMDHATTSPPPPPPKDRPQSAILLGGTSSAGTSRDHAMPGGFPSSPEARPRSASPPEPLLAAGVFASSNSDSTSHEHSNSRESHTVTAKPIKSKE